MYKKTFNLFLENRRHICTIQTANVKIQIGIYLNKADILNTSRCQKHKNSTMYFIITNAFIVPNSKTLSLLQSMHN